MDYQGEVQMTWEVESNEYITCKTPLLLWLSLGTHIRGTKNQSSGALNTPGVDKNIINYMLRAEGREKL